MQKLYRPVPVQDLFLCRCSYTDNNFIMCSLMSYLFLSVCQIVSAREKELGSLQCAKPRTFIFENNNHNLKIDISNVRPSRGWDPIQTEGVNLNIIMKIITFSFKLKLLLNFTNMNHLIYTMITGI